MNKEIRILIIDDSKTCAAALQSIFDAQPNIKVIGIASNGREGLELTKKLKPDLITMDIFMPIMDGVAATTTIMKECPTPILVISSPSNSNETNFVFDALKAGALSVIEKPKGCIEGDFSRISQQIVHSVRALAGLHVFKRTNFLQQPKESSIPNRFLGAKILALGSSTGGPEALQCILSSLPGDFPIPIAVTQHITEGFLPGLISWLQNTTQLKLHIVKNHEILKPGCVYFAENNYHFLIEKDLSPVAILDTSARIHYLRPSIDALFSSIVTNYPGAAIGGLLTGMGKDGAAGLLKMKESGCLTFVQSKETCIIYGMPKAAIELNAAQYTIDLEKIARFLTKLTRGDGL